MTDRDPTPEPEFTEEQGSAIRRALALPEVIDQRYRVISRLGAGAMGIVLRAQDVFLERPVAIKVVDPDPLTLERFVKEAQALAKVRHENVVQVYSFGPVDSSPQPGPLARSYYLAMELVVGRPLEEVIDALAAEGELMPLPRALAILKAIGLGLEAVHAQKLVHRDIKPGNIILEGETDRPVVIDFGLARRKSKSSPNMSIVGGTPSYMAPEQARDPDGRLCTARTDQYAFACTAFELFTGRPLFEGDDIYTILLGHLNEKPRKISSLRPELAMLDDVFLQALEKEPEKRFASVAAMLAAIDARLATPTVAPPPAPATIPAPPPDDVQPGILCLAMEPGLRRSLLRTATQLVQTRSLDLGCEALESVAQALSLVDQGACDVLLVDEESTGGQLRHLVERVLHRRPTAEVVVLTRNFQETARVLDGLGIRHLVPKPVNAHILASVLAKLAAANNGVPPSSTL